MLLSNSCLTAMVNSSCPSQGLHILPDAFSGSPITPHQNAALCNTPPQAPGPPSNNPGERLGTRHHAPQEGGCALTPTRIPPPNPQGGVGGPIFWIPPSRGGEGGQQDLTHIHSRASKTPMFSDFRKTPIRSLAAIAIGRFPAARAMLLFAFSMSCS